MTGPAPVLGIALLVLIVVGVVFVALAYAEGWRFALAYVGGLLAAAGLITLALYLIGVLP